MAARSPSDAIRPVGGFIAMALDTFRAMFKPPFRLREFLEQTLFVARVSIGPAVTLTIPFPGVVIFSRSSCCRCPTCCSPRCTCS